MLKVKIWDTAGVEKNANIIGSYVRKLDACFMVFDLTSRDSFDGVRRWIKQLYEQTSVPVVIVGNKYDLTEERQVSPEQLADLGRHYGVHTFETSAKTGHNVDSAFACLIYQVLKPCIIVREHIKADSVLGD